MINLTSPVKEVRKGAIACLNVLRIIKDCSLSPVVQAVMERTEEIVADSAYVSQVIITILFALYILHFKIKSGILCYYFLFTLQIVGNLFKGLNTSGSSKAAVKLSDALDQLLHLLRTSSCPSYVGKILLMVLRDVNGEVSIDDRSFFF